MSTRILLTTIVALLFVPLLRAQDGAGWSEEIVFTPEMTKADLSRIEKEMADKDIELKVENSGFQAGKLHKVSFSVKTAAGSGSASGELTPDRRFGFRYMAHEGKVVSFSVGTWTPPSEPAR